MLALMMRDIRAAAGAPADTRAETSAPREKARVVARRQLQARCAMQAASVRRIAADARQARAHSVAYSGSTQICWRRWQRATAAMLMPDGDCRRHEPRAATICRLILIADYAAAAR